MHTAAELKKQEKDHLKERWGDKRGDGTGRKQAAQRLYCSEQLPPK